MAVQTAFQNFQAQRYFGSLDGVRFISILAVLWHHSPLWWHNNPLYSAAKSAPMIANRGFLGVDLFFVLSGFLITTLLLREEARKGRFSIAGFYWRRALRILPVYFLLVTGLSIYYIFFKGQTEYAPLVPYYYLFMANFLNTDIPLLAPTWSLSVEEQFYFCWPLLLLFTLHLRRFRGWILGVAILFFGFVQQFGLPPGPIETAHATWAWPGGDYEAILLGALLAVVLHSQRGFALLHGVLGRYWMPLGILVALLVLLELLPRVLTGWPQSLVHLVMMAFLASVVLREDHVLRPILTAAPVVRLGVISYGIYLYHLIGLDIATRLGGLIGYTQDNLAGATLITLLFVVVSVVIAEISFRTYERYFLSLKGRL